VSQHFFVSILHFLSLGFDLFTLQQLFVFCDFVWLQQSDLLLKKTDLNTSPVQSQYRSYPVAPRLESRMIKAIRLAKYFFVVILNKLGAKIGALVHIFKSITEY
jgi:hypothetical protein